MSDAMNGLPQQPEPEREIVRPEVVGPDGTGNAAGAPDAAGDESATEQVTSPTKLIRIASMVRTMLDEVRRAPLDDAGRRRLREIHERSLHELEDVLSPDLRQELSEVVLPLHDETPSESELRLAQAQLVGWLEGLFHGIQAAMFAQQAAAQAQFQELQRRGLMAQNPPAGTDDPSPDGRRAGQYL
jgi:hypothetical protein